MDDHKLDSLTKMFNSEYFTDEMLVQYYHKTMNNTGIHDYLTNKLYSLSVQRIAHWTPFLCYMLIRNESKQLEKFIVDSCEREFWLFIKMFWCVHAFSATDRLIPKK